MEIIFVCQNILPHRNRVQFNRPVFLCNKYRVHVVARGYISEEAIWKAASVSIFPEYLPKILFCFWALWRIIKLRHNNNCIVYTTYEPVSILIGYISKRIGMKWIADIWDDPEKLLMIARSITDYSLRNKLVTLYRKLEHLVPKVVLRNVTFCITLIRPEMIQKYKVRQERIYSLTNGVNVDIKYPENRNGNNNVFTLGYVVALERTRLKYLPDLLERLFARIGAFHIYLTGPDVRGGREWVMKKLSKLSQEVRISITGMLPHNEILRIIAGTDVSLCLYPNEADLNPAYPIKILESMVMGKPVVATRLRGISEIINDGINGFLVDPGNVEEMVEMIARLKENAALRKKVGEMARKRAHEFDWKIIHNRLGEALDNFFIKLGDVKVDGIL